MELVVVEMELERQHRGIMKKDNFYFGSYTIKQISMIESEYFVIHFDGDFFNQEGYYLFTMSQAKKIYSGLIKDLVAVIHEGVQKDKDYAKEIMLGMIIEPVRYH